MTLACLEHHGLGHRVAWLLSGFPRIIRRRWRRQQREPRQRNKSKAQVEKAVSASQHIAGISQ